MHEECDGPDQQADGRGKDTVLKGQNTVEKKTIDRDDLGAKCFDEQRLGLKYPSELSTPGVTRIQSINGDSWVTIWLLLIECQTPGPWP